MPPEPEDLVARVRAHLMRRVAEIAGTEGIDPARPLQEYGLGSRDAVVLAGELEEMAGRTLPATLVWETPTVDAIVRHLAEETGAVPAAGGGVRGAGGAGSRAEGTAPSGGIAATWGRAAPWGEGEPVAVVGIGCRFPGGADGALCGPDAYWRFLLAGGDAVTEVPEGRWAGFDDGSAEVGEALAAVTRYGGFLGDVAGFDAEFFGISPAEAALMDPQQRLLLEVAWEAIEHAGIAPATLAGSPTAVFTGISTSEYAHLTAADLTRVQAWTATGAAPSVAAGRLSYLLDLRGPSLAVDTACSSSLVAVDLAARSLLLGESDLAIAGGVNLMLSPAITMTFDAAGGTSPTGRCRAFDADADGMVRGEGCGLVVLKRLSDARSAGDRVLAVLRGGAVNADGRSNGLVAPNPRAQRDLLRTALARTHLAPADIDYVEAHGTGTPLGDPIEAGALIDVLGADRPGPLLLGSAKTNLGHLEAAAGAAGLIKTVLALANRRIPPSLHFREPNPEIPNACLEVVTEPRLWPETASRRPRAGVSSFGFSGVNAHLILEGVPPEPPVRGRPGPVTTYVLHDRTRSRLRTQAAALAAHLSTAGPEPEPGDVAYTLVRRAGRGAERATVTGRTADGLVTGLRAVAEDVPYAGVVAGRAGPGDETGPVFVFAGQGSQWAGMAHELLRDEPVFADVIDEIDGLLGPYVPFSLRDVLDRGAEPVGVLGTQVTLFGVQVALARLWHAYGVRPAAVIGHSMGEVAAAVTSGGLSLADGVRVIATRAALLEDLSGRGAMAVLGVGKQDLAELVAPEDRMSVHGGPTRAGEATGGPSEGPGTAGPDGAEVDGWPGVYVAVEASPVESVVTGDADAVEAIVARVEAAGRLARLVRAQGAGHSPQVEPLLPELRRRLDGVHGDAPVVRCYSTVYDDPRRVPGFDAGHWAANLRSPVRLASAVRAAADDGHRTFVEISAHPVLARALRDNLGDDAVIGHSLRRGADGTVEFHSRLAALHVAGVLPPPHAGPGRLVDLPPAPWRHVPHWVSPPRRRTGGHRLLGAHVPLPDGRHAWRGTLEGPEAMTLGLAAALASAAAGDAWGPGPVVVRDLRLHGFLPLSGEDPPEITTSLDGASVTVSAQDAAGGWNTYITGRVSRADGPNPAPCVVAQPGFQAVQDEVPPGRPGIREVPQRPSPTVCEGRRGPTPDRLDACLRAAAPDGEPVAVGELRMDGDEPTATGVRSRQVHRWEIPEPPHTKLFELRWLQADLPAASDTPRTWAVHAPADPDLLQALTETADQARPVTGAAGAPAGPGLVQARPVADPADVPADCTDLILTADAAAPGPVSAPGRAAGAPPAPRDGGAGAQRAVLAVTRAVAALGGRENPPRVWIVVRDGRHAWLRGLVRTLAFEHPALRVMLVDIPDGDVEHLVQEIQAGAPDDEVRWRDGTRYVPRLARASRESRPLALHRDGAYVITGGLGGLGLAVARYLAGRGAGQLVLNARSAPSPQAMITIGELRGQGVRVDVVRGDAADPDVARDLVGTAGSGGTRLRGVVHAAGVADDRMATDISSADLDRVWRAKVGTAESLNAAIDASGASLDFWVGFSSAAALLGSPGQGAYAAANARLDEIATARGGTTINWGTWAEVGAARDDPIRALTPLTTREALEAFGVLAGTHTATGVLRLDADAALAAFPEITAIPFFTDVLGASTPRDDWPGADAVRDLPADQASARITTRVRSRVASLVGLDPAHLTPDVALGDLGVDSLVALRIVNVLTHDLGIDLETTPLLTGATLADLESHVLTEFTQDPGPGAGAPTASSRHQARPAPSLPGEPAPPGPASRPVPTTRTADVITTLQPSGHLPPLYLAHPAGSDTTVYRQLVELLGRDRPVYGLERLDGRLDVAERAKRYLDLLPGTGPYLLGGWSFGGVLAYEMARQTDHETELVIMLDSGLPLPVDDEKAHAARRFAGFAGYVARTYQADLNLDEAELRHHDPDAQLALVLERAEKAGLEDALTPAAWRHQRTSYEDTRALERYAPGPYDGRVVLYRATERTPWTVDDDRYDHPDRSRGFAVYCRDLEIVEVAGHHLNLLDPPYVEPIAAHLRGLLGKRGERID